MEIVQDIKPIIEGQTIVMRLDLDQFNQIKDIV